MLHTVDHAALLQTGTCHSCFGSKLEVAQCIFMPTVFPGSLDSLPMSASCICCWLPTKHLQIKQSKRIWINNMQHIRQQHAQHRCLLQCTAAASSHKEGVPCEDNLVTAARLLAMKAYVTLHMAADKQIHCVHMRKYSGRFCGILKYA